MSTEKETIEIDSVEGSQLYYPPTTAEVFEPQNWNNPLSRSTMEVVFGSVAACREAFEALSNQAFSIVDVDNKMLSISDVLSIAEVDTYIKKITVDVTKTEIAWERSIRVAQRLIEEIGALETRIYFEAFPFERPIYNKFNINGFATAA